MIDSTVRGQVILKPKRAQPFYGRHPWVFAGAIDRVAGEPPDGAVVDLLSTTGNFVARGLYNSQSKIRVRNYSWDESIPLDRDFFRSRLHSAITLRHSLLGLNSHPDAAYRVVFSEADGFSGLIVDRYGAWATAQITSLAIAERREMIGELIMESLGVRGVYLRTEKGIGKLEGVVLQDGPLCGEPPPPEITVQENGLTFAINIGEGQKTGYYLDQRDNRVAAARYARGKRVLDAFSYSGGFGIYAARAGAASVECVDASEAALHLGQRNATLNPLDNIQFVKNDVFRHLAQLAEAGRKFDLIVLDPPKFARDRAAIDDALKGYRRLHKLAVQLLEADGVLVSCCCTGLISMEMLEDLISQVILGEKRDGQILERRGPAADHPVAVSCREGSYLKCIISRVR